MLTSGFQKKHLLNWEDWSEQHIATVLTCARDFKQRFAYGEQTPYLAGKTLFMLLFDKSTLARNSIQAGMTQLGGHAHDVLAEKTHINDGETAKDIAIILSRLGHGIACQHRAFGIGHHYITELSKWATVPVISLQDDQQNPIQALADLLTLKEHFGENLKGLKVSICWSNSNAYVKPLALPHSQVLLFSRYGINLTLGMPKEFELNERVVHKARNHAQFFGGTIKSTTDVEEAYDNADIVIPQNWGCFNHFEKFDSNDQGQWKKMTSISEKYKEWTCNKSHFELASPDVKLLASHPLDRDVEVSSELIDCPDSLVHHSIENHLHVAKALLALTLSGRN